MRIIIAVSLLGSLAACSEDNKFKGGVSQADAKPEVVEETQDIPKADPKMVGKTLELTTRSTSSPVDMVWVVDNSGSMQEEVSQVRSNIKKFAESVSARADLKLSFISNRDRSFGLSIDDLTMSNDSFQVESYVGSHNAMSMLASAVCEASGTVLDGDVVKKICGQDVISTTENSGIYPDPRITRGEALKNGDHQASTVAGSLTGRLRTGSTRVFVFVTDDTSKGAVVGNNFMKVSGSDPAVTHVYAFAGVAKAANCEVANVGETYLELAKATGGEVFDICENDWSSNFSKLTENVIKLTSNTFEIPAEVKVIKAVKIKGKALAAKQYAFANGKLIIVDRSVLSENETVVIEYEVPEN